MQKSILIVEDEFAIADFLRAELRKAGFSAHVATTGAKAMVQFGHLKPDLVILDLSLPDMDGLEICRAIRASKRYVPIIMLTGRSHDIDRVVGLEIGADDYITKPFSMQELIARVRAVLRLVRSFADHTPHEHIRLGELEIDMTGREVLLSGQQIQLTPKEFDLLALMARSPGRVFERETLLEQVWGYDYVGSSRTVDIHVQRLRQKLGDDTQRPRYILTVRGVGYKFAREEGDH